MTGVALLAAVAIGVAACEEESGSGPDVDASPTVARTTPMPATQGATPPATATDGVVSSPTALPPAVGVFERPHEDNVSVGFADPGERLRAESVSGGEALLIPGQLVRTDATGDITLFYTDRGRCGVHHNTLIEIRPGEELFTFSDRTSEHPVVCNTNGETRFVTFEGTLTISSTTWGVLYDESGLHIDMFEGFGIVEGSSGETAQMIGPVSATIDESGNVTVVRMRELTAEELARIDAIGGSVAPQGPD